MNTSIILVTFSVAAIVFDLNTHNVHSNPELLQYSDLLKLYQSYPLHN